MQLPWRPLHQPPLPRNVRVPRRPSATAVLLTLCLLGATAQWTLRRLDSPADPLLASGALTSRSLAAGHWWTPVTQLFLATGPRWLWPVAWLTLAWAGHRLEAILGRRHLAGLFLLTGVAGGLGQLGFDGLLRRDEAPVAGLAAPALGFLLALACLAPRQALFPVAGSGMLGQIKVLHGALGTLAGAAFAGTQAPAAGALLGGLTGCLYANAVVLNRRPMAEEVPLTPAPVSPASSASWSTEHAAEPVSAPAPTLLVAPVIEIHQTQAAPRFTEREQRMTPREFIAEKIDPILEKISRDGLANLSAEERQLLDKAREKMTQSR